MKLLRVLAIIALLVGISLTGWINVTTSRIHELASRYPRVPFLLGPEKGWPKVSQQRKQLSLLSRRGSETAELQVFAGNTFYLMEYKFFSEKKCILAITLYSANSQVKPFLRLNEEIPAEVLVYQPYFIQEAPGIKAIAPGYWVYRYDGSVYSGNRLLGTGAAILQNPVPIL